MTDSGLFDGLDPEEARTALEVLRAEERAYGKGELLLRRGDVGVKAGLVLSGRVRMEASDRSGHATVLGWARPGDLFAEAYAVMGDEPMLVDVVCAEDCRVLWLDIARLPREAGEVPSKVLARLARLMAKRNLGLSERAFHCSPKGLRAKLMAYFTTMAERSSIGPDTFELAVTRQQLADYLGVDRSALCRELGRMARDGLVRIEGRSVRLLGGDDRP